MNKNPKIFANESEMDNFKSNGHVLIDLVLTLPALRNGDPIDLLFTEGSKSKTLQVKFCGSQPSLIKDGAKIVWASK